MKWRLRLAWAALAVIAVLAAFDGWRWLQATRLNRAMADGSIVEVEAPRNAQATFAQAWHLAARGDNERALNLYKRVQDEGGPLARAARYNAGNIHLRQAIDLQKSRGEAALGALITPAELAKQAYREVLRADPRDWDARFNLEKTLRVLPDPDDDTGGPAPGNSERAATTMRASPLGLP